MCVDSIEKITYYFLCLPKMSPIPRNVILMYFMFNNVKIKTDTQFVYRVVVFKFLHMENLSNEHQCMLNSLSPINEGYGKNVCFTKSH
jgi:hypothetical protein